MSRRRALLRLILLYFFLSSMALFAWCSYERAPHGVKVAFLDIGQGDSIFIQSPTGTQVLIDGGADRDVLGMLARAMPLFDHSIDVVISTHPDKDHLGGLPYVLQRYRVGMVLDPGIEGETQTFAFFEREREREQKENGAIIGTAHRGDVFDLGGGAVLRILFPSADDAKNAVDTNGASVVAQLVYGTTEVMLTGDAPKSVEEHLVSLDGTMLESTILKAGHHGSRTSTSELFVAAVAPQYTVISAGCDNTYGHPHAETLATLTKASTTILSTCEKSTITFVSDGKNLSLK